MVVGHATKLIAADLKYVITYVILRSMIFRLHDIIVTVFLYIDSLLFANAIVYILIYAVGLFRFVPNRNMIIPHL